MAALWPVPKQSNAKLPHATFPKAPGQAPTLTAFVVQVRQAQLHSSFKVTTFSSPEGQTEKVLEVKILPSTRIHSLVLVPSRTCIQSSSPCAPASQSDVHILVCLKKKWHSEAKQLSCHLNVLKKSLTPMNALQIRWIKRCSPSFWSRFIVTLSNFVTEIHLFFNTLVCTRRDQANLDLETALFSGAPDLT